MICVTDGRAWPQWPTTPPEALARLKSVVGQTHNGVVFHPGAFHYASALGFIGSLDPISFK